MIGESLRVCALAVVGKISLEQFVRALVLYLAYEYNACYDVLRSSY